MDKIFSALQEACQKEPYLPASKRRECLTALKKLLQTNADELAQAISNDFGHRSFDESLFLEVFPCIASIKYCLKHLKKWMKPRKRSLPWYFATAKASVFPQPLGVVAVSVPWNYPLLLAIEPAVYALAAGNRVMIKMSELTPHTGEVLKALIAKVPELCDLIAVINGDITTAKQFTALAFDHMVFTGSTATAKLVMATAAKNLTPLTLELGGKSPVIVSTTVNPRHFERIFMGKLFNAGQTCLAPDYLLIPAGWEARIEESFQRFMTARYPNLMDNQDYSAIISNKRRKELEKLLADASAKGGRVLSFGKDPENTSNKMPFSLVFNADQTMELMQQEIFGPILPVLSYHSINEAVELIKSMPHPLALYYFGSDNCEKDLLRTNILAGALTINDTVTHMAVDDLPFGGVGESGMGQYHGQEGFDNFSQLKPVFEQSRLSLMSLLYPPYGLLLRLFLAVFGGIKFTRVSDKKKQGFFKQRRPSV
jgi:coniferyl-aldehyde dehydrogenase